jgi:CheY-like chemotaxis protein
VLLFQSVRELLLNALKYAECREVAVRMEQADGRLCLEICDDGVGFESDAIDGYSPTAMSSKFGLFSIRERMRSLGGWFDMQSAPGQGTTATLVLPIGDGAVAGSELKVLSSKLGRPEPGVLSNQVRNSEPRTQNSTLHQQDSKIHVLLVDDHAMVRQGLKSVLDSYADIEVVGEAGDGEEAIAATERLRPAIVLMDIHMPKMNGMEATARIKARYPEIIVIGMSVQADNANREAMTNAGAEMLLTKEAAVDELYRAICQAMTKELPRTRDSTRFRPVK